MMLRTVIDEYRCDAVGITAMCRSSEFQSGELFLEFSCHLRIELKKLFLSAAPCRLPLRLIPDFPVPDWKMKTVRPPLRIMAYDVRADVNPFLRILGRIDEVMFNTVLYGGAKLVKDRGASLDAVAEVVIGLFKKVIARIIRIRLKIGEYHGNVGDLRIRIVPRRIMNPGNGQIQRLIRIPQIHPYFLSEQRRCHISPVQFFDLPDCGIGANLHCDVFHFFISSYCRVFKLTF